MNGVVQYKNPNQGVISLCCVVITVPCPMFRKSVTVKYLAACYYKIKHHLGHLAEVCCM